ncbi:hypothetical protein [Tahibacter amnicola]|uniref:Uncharacterized protein n=1 Tax=Tahibacter amnicola TaxID=2976241 RepID=A0ABY6BC79_9GAMM|nr:hypothetical protein [Tahibacter amnicola]UXI66778.1 hypothetical protein N4264_18765 [Tahibacter amnicola]
MARWWKWTWSNACCRLAGAGVILWSYLSEVWDCQHGTYYREVALIVAVACTTLWVNHVSAGARWHGRCLRTTVFGAFTDIGIALVLGVSASLLANSFMTVNCPGAMSRFIQVRQDAERVPHAWPHAGRSNDALQPRAGYLTEDGSFPLVADNAHGVFVWQADGAIIFATRDPFAIALLRPTVVNGTWSWTCSGFPPRYLYSSCLPLVH